MLKIPVRVVRPRSGKNANIVLKRTTSLAGERENDCERETAGTVFIDLPLLDVAMWWQEILRRKREAEEKPLNEAHGRGCT